MPGKGVALVIGSGSVLCAASAGLLQVFEAHGIPIAMVVGCSGGSLYAAAIALGMDSSRLGELSRSLWSSELYSGYAQNLRAALSGESRFGERDGLIDDGPMNARLRQLFGEKTFADCSLPLRVIAADLYTGESVTLQSGSLFDAARASAAIPMIFPPWEVNGRLLVDGAVADPLPVDAAIREGAEVIVALGFELPTRPRLRSYTAVANHFNALYMNNLLRASFAFHNLAHHAEIIPILPQFDRPISAFDGENVPYIIEQGRLAAEEQVEYIKSLLG